jgi:hypothetical protein
VNGVVNSSTKALCFLLTDENLSFVVVAGPKINPTLWLTLSKSESFFLSKGKIVGCGPVEAFGLFLVGSLGYSFCFFWGDLKLET